jgi:hypothetical protein
MIFFFLNIELGNDTDPPCPPNPHCPPLAGSAGNAGSAGKASIGRLAA